MNEPPESGSIEIQFPFSPVSLQASSSRRAAVRVQFQAHMPKTEFLLSGDVAIEIEWFLHENERYESADAPDVDNILKLPLDALSGPAGILINDNQVQSVQCSWIDWLQTQQQVNLRIRFSPDLFVSKRDLIFVDLGNSLCFPINKSLSPDGLRILLEALRLQVRTRQTLQTLGMPSDQARGVMPIQRLFHRSRLSAFEVLAIDEFARQLEGN